MTERDYPVGHPASADYTGQPYIDPHALFALDFAPSHPARGGRNVTPLDTPDGARALHNSRKQDLIELAAIKSLPPLVDPATKEALALSSEELALCYRVRNLLTPELAAKVTEEYQLDPPAPAQAVDARGVLTMQQQALNSIIARGYTPERAQELLDKYGVPDTLLEATRDANR